MSQQNDLTLSREATNTRLIATYVPPEIWSMVAAQLDRPNLHTLKRLARRFLPIADDAEFKSFTIELPPNGDHDAIRKFNNTQVLFQDKRHWIKELTIKRRGLPFASVDQGAHVWMRKQLCELAQVPPEQRTLQRLTLMCWKDSDIRSMVQCIENLKTLSELSIQWIAFADCPTLHSLTQLRKLHVNFDDDESDAHGEPIANLSTLARLQEVRLSSGWMEDCGASAINWRFHGQSRSTSTLIIEAETPLYGPADQSTDSHSAMRSSPLLATLGRFRFLRRLVLQNIGGQCLRGAELPLLETLEAYWCTSNTLIGIQAPALKNLSVAIAMEPLCNPTKEFVDLLESADRIVIRIEWNFSSLDDTPAEEREPLNIENVYQALKNRTRAACLVAGDVSGPGESLAWLRYRRRRRHRLHGTTSGMDPDKAAAKLHKKERLTALRKLKLTEVFRDSPEQVYEL